MKMKYTGTMVILTALVFSLMTNPVHAQAWTITEFDTAPPSGADLHMRTRVFMGNEYVFDRNLNGFIENNEPYRTKIVDFDTDVISLGGADWRYFYLKDAKNKEYEYAFRDTNGDGDTADFGEMKVMTPASPPTWKDVAAVEPCGPVSDWQIFYYADDTALYGALKAGETDVNYWETTPAQYDDAISDPDIQLAPTARLDYRAMSLNNNETIDAYKGVKSPMTNVNFRKAVHRCSNVEYWVYQVCRGFAELLPVTIAAPSKGWWNQSVVDFVLGNAPGRYPWPYDSHTYDLAAAAQLLTDAGFVDIPGETPEDTWRNYPAGWPGAGSPPKNVDPLKFYIRSDDALRREAGLQLAADLEKIGIQVDEIVVPFATCQSFVMTARNFHIYTAGWSMARFPRNLYGFFHSSRWFPGGSNYHLSPLGQGGLPEQPLIDTCGEKVEYPPTYEASMEAAAYAQYILTEKLCVMVPGWSAKAFYPFSSELLAVTNQQAIGPENGYTMLKAYKPGGGPVRAGLKSPPLEVNQIYSRWVWDVSTLGVWMEGSLSNPAYNLMVDQPSYVQDWTSPPGEWLDGAVKKSKMSYWYRDGLEWIDPVTGDVLADFLTQWLEEGGYKFNSWYFHQEPAGWIYSSYRDIHHIRIFPNESRIDVYFNTLSYWNMYNPFGRVIYAPEWKQYPLCQDGDPGTAGTQPNVATFTGPRTAGSTLPLPYQTAGAPVEIVSIVNNVTGTLKESSGNDDNDYEMVLGKIKLYTAVATNQKITVTYWARQDPAGYAPGGLFRENGIGKVWMGCGTHYATEHVPGAGGWTTYKKNPNYWMETPPAGEIDFWWNWISGPKPRDGYYLVDILDIVKATWAIDGEGWAVPSPNWEPGADLSQAVRKCKITVNDIVIVTGTYYKTFGSPSPNPPP